MAKRYTMNVSVKWCDNLSTKLNVGASDRELSAEGIAT